LREKLAILGGVDELFPVAVAEVAADAPLATRMPSLQKPDSAIAKMTRLVAESFRLPRYERPVDPETSG